ncbi:MAG: hypothetical protein LBL82_07580 [Oscillospiraceae bacterium]|jgi:ESS family glutamate:Na+ symporter|nr:hypothetical protein [Oscillospiraceae bacterium]
MDYSAANSSLWNIIIQLGVMAGMIILATLVRRKVPFIKKSLMPTAVIAGFLLLILRNTGLLSIDTNVLEMITYHGIAIGFIALSLRVPTKDSQESGGLTGLQSGAAIVSTYLIQAIAGTVIAIALILTIMPSFFSASGVLIAMGFGQGPGQANNVGTTYEQAGFAGGHSFALAIAAAGYLCACIVGVILVNILSRKRKVKNLGGEEVSGSVTVDSFQDNGEIPISESIDRLSVQFALVLLVYLFTFLVTHLITSLLDTHLPGVGASISPLLWGFNFIIGSMLSMLVGRVIKGLQKSKVITRQYQNNYLMSRISGLAFDIMIIAGIASINIEDLSGLWLPFVLFVLAGGVITLIYLAIICKRIYKGYYMEGLASMYGMLTGTISSGVLLLREIDPEFKTPAANNLITGSSFGILLGAPLLILIGMAPSNIYLVLVLMLVYFAALLPIIMIKGKKKPSSSDAAPKGEQAGEAEVAQVVEVTEETTAQ